MNTDIQEKNKRINMEIVLLAIPFGCVLLYCLWYNYRSKRVHPIT